MVKSNSDDSNGWDEWKNAVLMSLNEIKAEQKDTRKENSQIRTDISKLQVKSGIWGMVGGVIPVAIMIAFEIIRGLK